MLMFVLSVLERVSMSSVPVGMYTGAVVLQLILMLRTVICLLVVTLYVLFMMCFTILLPEEIRLSQLRKSLDNSSGVEGPLPDQKDPLLLGEFNQSSYYHHHHQGWDRLGRKMVRGWVVAAVQLPLGNTAARRPPPPEN